MRSVFMVTDMEGVAGVVSFEDQSYPEGKYYDLARQLETAEVNAAIEGLVDAGIEEILVWDGHGAGGINYPDLHRAAKLLSGRPLAPWSRLADVIRRHDACVMIGQHAMAGTVLGNQNHTQDSLSIDYYKLNGRPIGEIGQCALFCGALGLPLIFLSGDLAACREVEDLVPGICTVAVKEGVGRGSAISLSAPEARRRIREGIKGAVDRQREGPIAPLQWETPYILEKRFFHTDAADAVAAQPGAERVDSQTVRLYGDDILSLIYH